MTNNRLAIMDFAEGFAYTTVALIIPMPESSDNSAAVIRPFQITVVQFTPLPYIIPNIITSMLLHKQVWIILVVLMPIVAVVVYFCIRQYSQGMNPQNVFTLHQTLFEIFRVVLNQGNRKSKL